MADEWGCNYQPRPSWWRLRLARLALGVLGVDPMDVSEDEYIAIGDRLFRWRQTTRSWSLCRQSPRARHGAMLTFIGLAGPAWTADAQPANTKPAPNSSALDT